MYTHDEREIRGLLIKRSLHPQLHSLAPLLRTIASVLFGIPWYLLTTPGAHRSTLPHDVVRCIILAFLTDDSNADVLNTELETDAERVFDASNPLPAF
jgi:hypothetical protein